MSNHQKPEKGNLYRLPWSNNDNPIGWIEATDICNIKCKGCYRLIMDDGHKPLEQIKEEILFLKKWRNCDNITLAGGEPVLHPQILDIVRFIQSLKMKSIILTNGYALNDKLLKDLKSAGLMGLSFHIDASQTRPEFKKEKIKSELELNPLRIKFARMLAKHKLYAHFGITVTADNLTEVPEFIKWAIEHFQMIWGISLIIYRGLPATGKYEYFVNDKKIDMKAGHLGYSVDGEDLEQIKVKSTDVWEVIRKAIPEYDTSCYLGGTHDHTSFKWLIGNILVGPEGKVFGHFGKKTLEIAQTMHHLFKGTYIVYPKKRIGRIIFLMILFDRKIRKAFRNYFSYILRNPLRLFQPVKAFGIGIVQAPDMLEDGSIDMCDDCPDMCVHDGKLVNSCRLDECRIYGGLLHAHTNGNVKKDKKEAHQLEEMKI